MNIQKEKIVKALKHIVVPKIKELDFWGVFPHFRRIKNNRYEFISFQFNRYGGSFVVEVGFVAPDFLHDWEKKLPFDKLNYGNTHIKNRLRIKPENVAEDFWFDYLNFKEDNQFEVLAQSVKALFPRVESFFEKNL